MTKPGRNYGLDIIRVIACYMVVQLHAGEFFYTGHGDMPLSIALTLIM